eukprot:TRINITY_DN4452_c0_g2_i1.p1 TRINITY_DN4452_c0_g2~~TRINITY_DN4452_c0_g2_i1.p1  ORF type:complete len:192 (-),score=12.61 TRINITY_DN4452_c0_g2_i1:1038-1613(-)
MTRSFTDGSETRENKRIYNPYGDLNGAIDYKPLRNLYELPTSPEFLFQEEAAVQRRSWGENLQYYTGCGYLLGAVSGAGVGMVEGLKAREPGDSLKLRINRVLNASGHSGRKFGNKLGVIGLLYAGMESGIVAARNGQDDIWNSVSAGLATGALYRATAGPRSAAVAGAIGGVVVGALVAGKQVLRRAAII